MLGSKTLASLTTINAKCRPVAKATLVPDAEKLERAAGISVCPVALGSRSDQELRTAFDLSDRQIAEKRRLAIQFWSDAILEHGERSAVFQLGDYERPLHDSPYLFRQSAHRTDVVRHVLPYFTKKIPATSERFDLGFHGSLSTHPVRRQLLSGLDRCRDLGLTVDWHDSDSHGALDEDTYHSRLGSCRFVLCPQSILFPESLSHQIQTCHGVRLAS